MDADSQRSLGRVESACESLTDAVKRILDNQEAARRDVLAATAALNDKFDRHAATDEQGFSLVREGLGGLRDRIARLEPIADTVESLEAWRKDSEEKESRAEATHQANKTWTRAIIGAAGVGVGAAAHKNGPGFWKWLLSLF